jgi:hypothetical protein
MAVCGQPGDGWGQDVETANSIMPVTSLSDAARLWTKKKFRADQLITAQSVPTRKRGRPATARRVAPPLAGRRGPAQGREPS